MALSSSVLLALAMLCSSPACTLGCDLPPSSGIPETFSLLSQMERISILYCLADRTDFRIPQMLMDGSQLEKTRALAVVQEVLQQVFSLFSTSDSLTAWDETVLDKFLVGIYQQLNDLQMCLGKEKEVEGNSGLAVKRYFRGISLYLKERGYSRCAWEVVRVEIRRCLFFINNLTENFRK